MRAKNIDGSHFGDGNHRQTGGHRFQQYKTLRLGTRGKDKNVGRCVAGPQLGSSIEITDELHASLQTTIDNDLPEKRQGRTFASNQQQNIRYRLARQRHDVEQKVDVFFVRNAPDKQRHGPRLINTEACAKSLPRAKPRNKDAGTSGA